MALLGQTMGAISPPHLPFLLLLFLTSQPVALCQTSTQASSTTSVVSTTSIPPSSPTPTITATFTTTRPATTTTLPGPTTTGAPSTSTRAVTLTAPPLRTSSTSSPSNTSLGSGSTLALKTPGLTAPAPGCGPGLDPVYSYLCDTQAAWGIVVESLASLGFVLSAGLLLGLLLWSLWRCCCCGGGGGGGGCCRRSCRCGGSGGSVVSLLLFLLGTAGLFALTFAFVVRLTPQTCPTRLFLFGVLSALCFSALLARGLALLGFGVARGWAEPVVALALTAVQVIIAAEWLLMVLVRHDLPCSYEQDDFAMLVIYVLCLLAAAIAVACRLVWRTRRTYGYSYRHTTTWSRAGHTQAVLLLLTVLLAAAVWVVWIALLTRGNPEMGRRPGWDDPVLSVALVSTGWVLLLGHGLCRLVFLCRGEARTKGSPLDFTSWTSPSPGMSSLPSPKGGRDNGSFENDADDRRGKRSEPVLRSPYESGFSMTEIDPDKDYSIPRPQTTNINEPYDEYYGPRQS
ncbi:G-protein coupled receptor family C group 5 member D [Sardina pilchardus]|uniref:G-protein coupled receptor family C group 5 member D n=1 Tax=Sardina pilchardus TaxID=27697 RepID=UPI002E10DE57